MLIDNNREHIESKQYLLKPHGYKEISNKAVDVGITIKHAIEHGSDARCLASLVHLKYYPKVRYGFVIAYNIEIMNSVFTSNCTKNIKIRGTLSQNAVSVH